MLYVAYGSNMNLEQMAYRCPDAKVMGTGVIKGYILMFRGNPVSAVATIQKDRAGAKHINNGVPVVVWDISEADEKALDQYEGFPRLYKKDSIDVEMSDGSKLKAMVYIMTEGYGIGIPSGHYFNTILEGYLDNGIDTEYLFKRLEMMTKLMK